jgi:Subtilase family/Peptidase inhibitor I9
MTMIPKWTRMLSALLPLILFATAARAGDGKIRRSPHPVKDEYIVILRSTTPPDEVPGIAQNLTREHGARLHKVWKSAIKGFHVTMTEGRAQAMSRHPEVEFVEENARTFLSATTSTKIEPGCVTNCTPTTDNRLWHLDAMDQDAAVATHDFSSCSDGTGVNVYVVDTGVLRAHQEFENSSTRVLNGYDASGDPAWFAAWKPCGGPEDQWMLNPGYVGSGNGGHGTGVASLVAGKTLGVARNAKIVPVKVMPCAHAGARRIRAEQTYVTGEFVERLGRHFDVTNGGFTDAADAPTSTEWNDDTVNSVEWNGVIFTRSNVTPPTEPSAAMLVDGLNWIYDNAVSPAVVTLSTYIIVAENAGETTSVENAINALLDDGITVVASANNQNGNACDTSPGRLSQRAATNRVITAGGTMLRNNPDPNPANGGTAHVNAPEPDYLPAKPTVFARWVCGPGDSDNCSNVVGSSPPDPALNPDSYGGTTLGSNGGQCVTLFAPAKNIPVASMKTIGSYRDPRASGAGASGTSWSAPIVAGMAARMLQANNSLTPAQVRTALLAQSRPELDSLDINPPGVTGTTNLVLQLTDVDVSDLPLTIQATNGSATITATTVPSSGSFTFELYKVGALFDVAQYHRNAEKAEKVAGPQTSSSFTVSPTTDTSYFVRARSSCSTSDSTITTVVVSTPPAAPATFTATRNGSAIDFSWSTVSNADGYRVEHKLPGAAWATSGTFTTSPGSVTAPSTPGGVVLYRVRATRGSLDSAPSVADTAWVGSFTGDPAITGSTDVLGAHLVELRRAVNGLCAAADLAFPFNNPAEIADGAMTGASVDDSYSADLMTRLNTCRTNPAVGMAAWGFSVPLGNRLVTALDITELRNGVK